MIKKVGVLIVLLTIFLSIPCYANLTITREISSYEITSDKEFEITIKIKNEEPKDRSYIIEETIPLEFEIIDDDHGIIEQLGHIKWSVCEELITSNEEFCNEEMPEEYTYVIKAPSEEKIFNFYGDYKTNTQEEVIPILGDNKVSVIKPIKKNYSNSPIIEQKKDNDIMSILFKKTTPETNNSSDDESNKLLYIFFILIITIGIITAIVLFSKFNHFNKNKLHMTEEQELTSIRNYITTYERSYPISLLKKQLLKSGYHEELIKKVIADIIMNGNRK